MRISEITSTYSINAQQPTLMLSEEDLAIMAQFFKKWRLCPSMDKTEVCCFYLNNKEANRKLSVTLNGIELKHNFTPKYLGDTLDRSLTHIPRLDNLVRKLKTRNNLMQKP